MSIDSLGPRKKDSFHDASRNFVTGLHVLDLTETHLLGTSNEIVPPSAHAAPLPNPLSSKVPAILEMMANLSQTSTSFLRATKSLTKLCETLAGTPSPSLEDTTPPAAGDGRRAIKAGYELVYNTKSAVKYLHRLTCFADGLRHIAVSISPLSPCCMPS